jgi:c(7)-type cytochrome triheme protein
MTVLPRLLARLLATVGLLFALAGPARAVPPGLTIEFDGNGEGKVVFVGAKHTGKDMHCEACHLELFDVSRSSRITRLDHRRKVYCFACHDGKRAFAARGKCDRCHLEPATEPEVPALASATTSQ